MIARSHEDYLKLGASLYVPCTLAPAKLTAIANGSYAGLRSVIFDTEDSVRQTDLEDALNNFSQALGDFSLSKAMLRFLRVRNLAVLERVVSMPNIYRIDGFVIPKATHKSMPAYISLLGNSQFLIMPTLETEEMFHEHQVQQLLNELLQDTVKHRVLCVRVGGNDLLNAIGLRRNRECTVYQTPIAAILHKLICEFRLNGFNLSAPVFEVLDNLDLLREEVNIDVDFGIFAKTAVHPSQIEVIENCYKVQQRDLDMARAILEPNARAVFRMHGTMCEPATHAHWARSIVERAAVYGVTKPPQAKRGWSRILPMLRSA